MDFLFQISIFVLSSSLVAESVPQHGLDNFDPFTFDEDFVAMATEMSELHPVFFHSSPPQNGFVQNFRRGHSTREENQKTHASPELSFGFSPLNPKPSRFNRGQQKVPSPLHQFDSNPESTHQTLALGPNFLRLGGSGQVSKKWRFETDSQAQRFVPDSSRNVREDPFHRLNQKSKLDHGLESVRIPTRHEGENTFSHYYRSFHRNSHPDWPKRRPNTQERNINLKSQRPDRTYTVRDNPTYTQLVPGVHSAEKLVRQNYYDIREKVSPNPNNPSHNPGQKKRTILLLKTPFLMTTDRPDSAPPNPRGFRTRPQHHAPQQSEVIEQSSKPRLHSISIPSVTVISRSRVNHPDFPVSTASNSSLNNGRRTAEPPSSLEAQHSHRLEQSDQNLYYRNDPFLDITEVYSHRPGSSFVPNKAIVDNSKSENKNQSVIPANSNSSTVANNQNNSVIRDSKSSTFVIYPAVKDSKSSTLENKVHSQGSKSTANNRTISLLGPVSYSASVSVDRKKNKSSRKMTLKKSMSMRKKSKELIEEPSSIPGRPGSDYPTYEEVPPTNFNCGDMKSSGYYADMETGCQVFHNCDTDKQKHSFLCPNGTIFRQELFICDWWYNVKCDDAWDFFPLND